MAGKVSATEAFEDQRNGATHRSQHSRVRPAAVTATARPHGGPRRWSLVGEVLLQVLGAVARNRALAGVMLAYAVFSATQYAGLDRHAGLCL